VPEDFLHRVGRTARAGARGTASTFATRSERSDVALIERTLATRLVRQPVSSEDGAGVRQPERRVVSFGPGRRARHSVARRFV
jgi:ATP-dependent RNA helicase RhlE